MITRQRKAIEAERKAREVLEKQLAEEREKAAEERRQLLATIELLTQRLAKPENGGDGRTP